MRSMFHPLIMVATFLGLLISQPTIVCGDYSFINVADTNTPAPIGNFTNFRPGPAISLNASTFVANYGGRNGIFMGNGGAITKISEIGDTAPFGTFSNFGVPTASLGAVSFSATYSTYSNGYVAARGVFSGNGGSLSTIAKAGDPAPMGKFINFGPTATYAAAPAGLDPNTVVFIGTYDSAPTPAGWASGIFIWTGGAPIAVVKYGDTGPSGTLFGSFAAPALTWVYQDCCTPVPSIAFTSSPSSSTEGIYTITNGVLKTIATKTSIPAHDFGDPVALGNSVAFRINKDVTPFALPPQAIWSNYSGTMDRIVLAGDAAPVSTFTKFGDPTITDKGIAFEGTYANGTANGIFARLGDAGSGYLGPVESIIKTGDNLFGSSVASVSLGRFGATAIGDLVFSYVLEDGRRGIALAIALPEPTTVMVFILASACFLAKRPAKRRNGTRRIRHSG